MLQRFGIGFILMFIITIILAFCITEDKAGVILRNFKSRRMIMEELEAEEKAVKARLGLNLSNATDARIETSETVNLLDEKILNNTDNNAGNDDLAVDFKNVSMSLSKKNLTVTSKQKIPIFKTQNSVVSPQIKNKTSLQKPKILTNSFVEYLETRGRRMEDQMLSFEKDEEAIPTLISTNETESLSPFRLISQDNESLVITNEISEASFPTEAVDLDEIKEMPEIEQENKVISVREMDNDTLKNSDFNDIQNDVENAQLSMKNITDIMKEILDTDNSELPKNNFSDISPESPEKDIRPEENQSNEIRNIITETHANSSELMLTFNDTISVVQVEEQLKNLTLNTTNKKSEEPLVDVGMNRERKEKETKINESSIIQIVSETEEEMTERPFEKSPDIIKEAAKEVSEIIPASNETVAVENVEVFVANLTDAIQKMSEEEIMDLEPEDEQISQSIQKEIPAINSVEKENASTTIEPKDKQITQSIPNENPAIETVEKRNVSTVVVNDTVKEFELNLESVVSSGLDFIVNSDVIKNAAEAMEVFNLSDSSLTDHVIEDTDIHSFIDIMMPSASIDEIESISKDQEFIGSDETTTSSQSMEDIEITQIMSELGINTKFNESLVKNKITNSTLEDTLVLDPKPNATSAAERKCPTPGICVFWFMARDTCSDHTECLGDKMCCRVRCSKNCIDI